MSEPENRYCELALPVPVDRLFTYRLPLTLRPRTAIGCRVLVPFGKRKLVGVVLAVHPAKIALQPSAPESSYEIRDVIGLLDEEPVLNGELLRLAYWIADYYCSPLGEVLRGMLPLGGEIRRSKQYSLTPLGRDVARQLVVTTDSDPSTEVLALLERREQSMEFLAGKISGARQAVKRLMKRGWIVAEERQVERDPARASSEHLEVEFQVRPIAGLKLKKNERELLAFLELHPGPHNLAGLSEKLKGSSEAARALSRRELVRLEREGLAAPTGYERPVPELNPFQAQAVAAISLGLAEGQFAAFLLQGVTGSGKTEVYLRSIEAALARSKNAMLLVPEIALTPAVAGQFFQRFGKQVAILHSAFGEAERADQWRRIRNGQARVVVGTRSGVFAPVQNLGLVIVDEEHDGSYKQQEAPRYHGRDVALIRAKEAGAVTVLGSATPSVESRYNAEAGKYKLLLLPERIASRPMPTVEIVDMRLEFLETKRQSPFSRKLLAEMEKRLGRGEQTILLLNRRGFSSFVVCRACGDRLQCVNCSVVLTHHRRDRRMLCHTCSYAEKIPTVCPKCGSEQIQFLGTGSERVEEELHQHLPVARIARLDRDSAAAKGAFEDILQNFRNGDIDILVGTQMIAKGHDIPNVTLVGVVLADIGLSLPDFRAAERTFQLLTQAAGRAGRGETKGEVLIQTLNPDHYAVRLAAEQDYEGFYKKEVEFRKWLRYPPFAALANVVVRASQQEESLRMATELGYVLTPPPQGIRVMGPAESPVLRIKSEFRYQLLLKASSRSVLRQGLQRLRAYASDHQWNATSLVIDVDPISLM